MKIEAVTKKFTRNNQLGDYYKKGKTDFFEIKKLGNKDQEKLVFLHEFIEQWLTEREGIREEDIFAFDEAHPNCPEPGMLPDSPYRKQHIFAENIERIVAHEIGINFEEYNY